MPICNPENYVKLRELEEKLTPGTTHPLPVLVIGNRLLWGEQIIPEIRRLYPLRHR
ncbi:MAG: hypothetical protein N2248_00215 [candidate division WOR-3 bacterium]|mgnify:CR=1 FL=1|nr:hypothetical protein [candidate division WOR-3 bacterium]